MPLFVLPVLWVLTVILGALFLLIPKLRAIGIYVTLVPTCGGAGSLILGLGGMAILALSERLFHFAGDELAPALSFLVGMVLGGLLGIWLGAVVSKRIIRKLGWRTGPDKISA